MRIGAVAVARPTFDVPYAEEMAAAAFAVLDGLDAEVVGGREVALDDDGVARAAAALAGERLDLVVVLQASFTDSTLVTGAVATTDAPLLLWAFPEERTGGRLRLNSLCGINLAGYALTRAGRPYRYLYASPRDAVAADVLAGGAPALPEPRVPPDAGLAPDARGRAAVAAGRLASARVGLIGDHPIGFEPCAYDPAALAGLTGATVDPVPLERLFQAGRQATDAEVAEVRNLVDGALAGVAEVDQESLAASLRLHLGMRRLVDDGGWSGVATRCWPECFTEFGGAACAPHALLTEAGTPGCCEADVYGNVTALMLQALAGGAAFVADLVHVDPDDGTLVMWHCGLAPLSMAGSPPAATVHSNRRKPLLHEFVLRPGRVTVARLSQAGGRHALVIGGGEMLDRPLPFGGTAGVLRSDAPAESVLDAVMGHGLEHHYGIAYGDVRDELRALAAQWRIPVIDLDA